jgi:DNA-binding IscR family transcriptional regulator
VCSAREIAGAYALPLPLLMNILKSLHRAGLLRSTRGTKGGYQIDARLDAASLHDLIETLEGGVKTRRHAFLGVHGDSGHRSISGIQPMDAPVRALHYRLVRFLKDVKLSDLVLPGRRIDVPVEMVRVGRRIDLETASLVTN